MKKLSLVVVLALIASVAYSQRVMSPIKAQLFKTYTNYTSSSDDTSGYVTVPVVSPLEASEVGIIAVSTDSVEADIQALGRNSQLTTITAVAIDSITTLGGGAVAWSATTPKTKVFMLKGPGVNLLAGCDQFKVGMVFHPHEGTSTGRTLKLYLWWKY